MPSSNILRVLVLAFVTPSHVFASPSVNVGMTAAFKAGPYLLELLEAASGENATAYFPLLDRIASGYFAPATSDFDLYERFVQALQEDGHISSPEALSTFNLALSLRAAAPRIEAHYQYYSTVVEPAVAGSNCSDWVLLEGKQYCTPTVDVAVKGGLFQAEIKTLPFDRAMGAGREAVLYADPASPTFGEFHRVLSRAAQSLKLKYRLRYRRCSSTGHRPLPVSGYGVELALKKTDYIVIDDRDEPRNGAEDLLDSAAALDTEVEVADLRPLSTSDLATLGLKAASFIHQSTDPFQTLVKLSQDLPRYAASLTIHNVSQDFVAEFERNKAIGIRGGINFLWINGLQIIDRQIDPFSLIDILRRERKLISVVRDLGLNAKEAVSLLGHAAVSSAQGDDEPVRYDWTDRLEDGRAIVWLNNLEVDARYEDYPRSLISLMQRAYPGQIPPVGRNIFNVVIPADLSRREDVAFISKITLILRRGIPIRFGLVPLKLTSEASAQAKVLYYLAESYGAESVMAYVQSLSEAMSVAVDEKLVLAAVSGQEPISKAQRFSSLAEILASESYATQTELAMNWANRLRADTNVRPFFINGIVTPRDDNWMQAMSMRIGEDLQTVQKEIFQGTLDEDTWIPGIFIKGAATRRNPYIGFDDDNALRILDVNKIYSEHADFMSTLPVLDASSESTKENWAVLTVIADLTADDGLKIVLAALEFKRDNLGVRLEILHNPTDPSTAFRVNEALKAELEALQNVDSKVILSKVVSGMVDLSENEGHALALSRFLAMAKLKMGAKSILLNGRIVGPIAPAEDFTAEDFQLLLDFERQRRIIPVYEALDDLGLGSKLSTAIAAAKATSITALSTISDLPEGIFDSAPTIRSTIYDSWNSTHTGIEIGNADTASVHIAGLLDPVSEKGQRWAPILKTLSELDGVFIKLILNPRENIAELPVKRFFRFVIDSKPSFDATGAVGQPKAMFKNLPSEALFTAGMDVPPAWLVAPKESVHDLDNIKLSSIKSDVGAMYELEHILIEGHSRDSHGAAPRGAQLVLATENEPLLTDTTIMSNLGFFQFKANPGFYNIHLKTGRTADMYTIESIGAQGWEAVLGDEGTELALMDFQGATVYPRLRIQPGMEEQDVLQTTDISTVSGLMFKGRKLAQSLFGVSKGGNSVSAHEHADINIFSVASGHLYERMLNIMMVSVMRNTKHSVKFWFIGQFLSPSFKDFIPHMAQEYGFKYEMVTYKWPHWLRQQKEKQREIWGYKILFLDVLFPLSLDKVIFVDADQIVRTDMIDLVNLDLEGAPYGFTPMCDSRTEMEGFRFWKQGYWATYLRGKSYHISALYVVDLHRFRALAAGDRLRQQYHTLSADPASLSNLDQDLPNHMQSQIPIHSLPQEWLWCETWCSDESLAAARTIDLCNNPQTKEPKLDRARRQVPEWTIYDDEIAALDKRRRADVASKSCPVESASDCAKGSPNNWAEQQQKANSNIRRTSQGNKKGSPTHAIDEL